MSGKGALYVQFWSQLPRSRPRGASGLDEGEGGRPIQLVRDEGDQGQPASARPSPRVTGSATSYTSTPATPTGTSRSWSTSPLRRSSRAGVRRHLSRGKSCRTDAPAGSLTTSTTAAFSKSTGMKSSQTGFLMRGNDFAPRSARRRLLLAPEPPRSLQLPSSQTGDGAATDGQ